MSALQSVVPENASDRGGEEQREILFRVINRVAVITLNRPAALNALSHAMIRELAMLVEHCRNDDGIVALVLKGAGNKGFCAGGDVREVYRLAKNGDSRWLAFFVDEYRLDYALHTFPKPVGTRRYRDGRRHGPRAGGAFAHRHRAQQDRDAGDAYRLPA
ncbi:1,4-dihydroxy-2-naphthoyl-CoA synthase [Paraburkholderia kirstenboschensis]|nr:1,4-dihydroxy-2-naphthoyl-CoA synthase [Paraburkholderia kirstenboschensis]